MRHPDLIGAVVIFLVGLVAIAAALTTPDPGFGVVGPGVFAAWLGGLVLVTAVWIGISALRAPEIPRLAPIDQGPLVASIVAIAIFFVVFVRVGFVLSSASFLVVESRILGSRHLVRDVIAAVVFVVALDIAFVRLLGVQLPAGVLSF